MAKETALAESFMSLFKGLDRAHGVYLLPEGPTGPSGLGKSPKKVKGKAITKRTPYTINHWEEHLAGKRGLGIIPIQDDGKVHWGCVDIDRYDIEPETILEMIEGTKLVPARTKSGGHHIFIFAKQPIPAAKMRIALRTVSIAMGFGGAEIFPKQENLQSDDQDFGNWLNMPYFGGERTTRYGYDKDGPISPDRFLQVAEKSKVTLKELKDIRLKRIEADDTDIPDGPPCLQHLTKLGFPSGSRNNGLFNLGVYYRKAHSDDWEKRIEEANQKWMSPGSSEEVSNILRSLRKKDYAYKCDEKPICDHCDRDLCRTRKYGVGDAVELPIVQSVTKVLSDPPVYYLDVSGVRIGPMSAEDILSQNKFRVFTFNALSKVFGAVKTPRWYETINALMETAVEVDIPFEATGKGQLYGMLEDFLTGKYRTDDSRELLMGRVLVTEDSKCLFRLSDFLDFLDRNRFKAVNGSHTVAAILRERGLQTRKIKIANKTVHIWEVEDPGEVPPIRLDSPSPEDEVY